MCVGPAVVVRVWLLGGCFRLGLVAGVWLSPINLVDGGLRFVLFSRASRVTP